MASMAAQQHRLHATSARSSQEVIDLDSLTDDVLIDDEESFRPVKSKDHPMDYRSAVKEPQHAEGGGGMKPARKSFFDVETQPIVSCDDMRPEVKLCIYLLGELYAMGRSDILMLLNSKRKARSAPILLNSMFDKDPNKLREVIEIISHAEFESDGLYGFSNIARKFGRIEEETKKAILQRDWNDRSLEAKHLEYSCKASLRKDFVSPDLNVLSLARHGRTVRVMAQRLLKAVNEEYEATSAAAVGGIYNYHRERTLEILRETPMRETVAVFCRFATKYVMAIGSPAFLSLASHLTPMLIEKGIYQNPVEDDPLMGLHKMMGLMDTIEKGVERLVAAKKTSWIDISLANLAHAREHILNKENKCIEPAPFVHTLAAQTHHWETLIKNDVPLFREIDPIIFDAITMGVTVQRVLRTWTNEIPGCNEARAPLRPYATLLQNALREKELLRSEEIVRALYAHSGVSSVSISVTPELFEVIELQMHSYGMDAANPSQDRIRLIYYQLSELSSQSTGTFSLVSFITRVASDMIYHLRFKAVLGKLDVHTRDVVMKEKAVSFSRVEEFEAACKVPPIPIKTISFLTTIFTYLLTTSTVAVVGTSKKDDAPCQRLVLPSGCEEFAVLNLTFRRASTDLKIVHPVQFEHKSWMQADDRGIYRMLPSQPLMGSMSRSFARTRPPMLEALDCMSRVGWRFNRYVMHVEEMIVVEGYGFHKLMPSFFPITSLNMPSGRIRCESLEADPANRKYLVHEVTRRLRSDQAKLDAYFEHGVSGVRRGNLFTLRTARTIVNKPQFFIPQKIDFRGRMYSLTGHTNPGAADPQRALLDFSVAKPLGKHGLYWLKIHLANVMGCSKMSFDERIQYVDDHMDDVILSAESPLGGDRWWQEAAHPMQALRACKEVHDALAHSQGVENFESFLPVHIDGTCNGLQHYSAIARDELGGLQVNLVPTPRPQDVYTGVLNAMLPLIHGDAKFENRTAQSVIGSGKNLDHDHLTRRTIKTAVMTQVYGVTNYGMVEMIEKELLAQNHAHNLWSKSMIRDMARYLCAKLLQALGITFRRAGRCRDWMNETIDTIWKCQPDMSKQCFQWTTPLGLIVRQPYTKGIMTSIYTPEGSLRVECSQVNHASRSQISAFAPNLIHSLDACHLAMTALEMDRIGLKMASVHDSFWTHACDLPVLSRILRQEFANLYKNYDPLWELKEQFEEQFYHDLLRHGVKLKDPPLKGELNLDEIMKSKYFFA